MPRSGIDPRFDATPVYLSRCKSVTHQAPSQECLEAPALPAFFCFSFNGRGYALLTVDKTASKACFLFPAAQVILRIREQSRKTDPLRIHRGSIYSHRNPLQMRENTFHTRRQRRLKVGVLCPAK